MKKQFYTVNDITKITGITRRTLHYYDEIGILKPTKLSNKGYRMYDISAIEKLQVVLFLKEMNLSLKDISDILKLPKQEQNKILEHHYNILYNKKLKLEDMMLNLEQYLSGKDIFELSVFENTNTLPLKEQYKLEGKVAYGNTEKYKEYEKNMSQLTNEEKNRIFASFDKKINDSFRLFAVHIKKSPDLSEVQDIVRQWSDAFRIFFECDNDILLCIANSYKFDNRFKQYINKFSNKDLSDFIYQAIKIYCNKNQSV